MNRIIIITTFVLLTLQVFGQDYKHVNTETLNIREGAGKEYNVVGQVNKGDKVNALSESGSWTQIETETGLTGFVATKFLSSTVDEPKSSDKKDSSWVSILVVLGIIGYGLYKIKNFFSGLFGGGSSNRTVNTTSSNKTVKTMTRNSVEQKQKYFCKCCGKDFNSVRDLTSNSCFNSPTKKHLLFEGEVSSKYYCNCCGKDFNNLRDLTSNSCFNSSTGKHQPYEGSSKSKYSCKDCGKEFNNLRDLTSNSCFNSPTKKHRPAK